MFLPINIHDLLCGAPVEWERVEFKAGWNPEDVLHTICAFANDFHNLGGGYLLIGIAEQAGRPVLPPVGIAPEQLDGIQKELLHLGFNAISPWYHPLAVPVMIDGAQVLVIWAQGGQTRPYKAKRSLAKDSKDDDYYIRKGSSTVRAKGADEAELMSLAASVPFDDRFNSQARMEDLSRELMQDYLRRVGSELTATAAGLSLADLGRQMGVVNGPAEALMPLNIGLMMFNPEPWRFFPAMQIDIVWFPKEGPGGNRFSEKIFKGPIPRMTRDALDYIARTLIFDTVIKHPDRAEATRVANFPFAAIEEAVVNAVYHRGYDTREPIEVRIETSDLFVISYPGPDRSVQLAQLRSGQARPRRYRNRRIGEFLKELKFTEGRATGIPKIVRAMQRNGSPPAEFEFDDDHSYFLVRLPIHPAALAAAEAGPEDESRGSATQSGVESGVESLSGMEHSVLELLQTSVKAKLEIAQKLGKRKPTRYLNDLMKKMLGAGLIEYTLPDTPNSRLQKYRITEKGHTQVKIK